jgi:anti-anti-sigma factor
MEILTQQLDDAVEVKVSGRLDNYWTEHLRRNLDEIVRGGAHAIRMNLADITFLSSAGVGLLVRVHMQLKGMGGSFVITTPSQRVKEVLDLCHLSPMLLSAKAPAAPPTTKTEARRFSSASASFEVMECPPGKPFHFQKIGDPNLLSGCRFGPQNCQTVTFPSATFGLGLGAFGHSFEDSQTRFGEFLAVDGSAAYLPTDGTNVPDFMVSSGDLVPEISMLYGLRCSGAFTHQVRFEIASSDTPIPLAALVRTALEVVASPVVGIVIIAESAGLIGAALRRSPALAAVANGAPFDYPEVRSWLSFSTERLYPRSLALIAGVAASSECPPLAPLLRPLSHEPSPVGHFHAAAFTYRPLKKGSMDMKSTVTTLFETETLQGVLHLLSDDRESEGRQQSQFVRGACWLSAASELP